MMWAGVVGGGILLRSLSEFVFPQVELIGDKLHGQSGSCLLVRVGLSLGQAVLIVV